MTKEKLDNLILQYKKTVNEMERNGIYPRIDFDGKELVEIFDYIDALQKEKDLVAKSLKHKNIENIKLRNEIKILKN